MNQGDLLGYMIPNIGVFGVSFDAESFVDSILIMDPNESKTADGNGIGSTV